MAVTAAFDAFVRELLAGLGAVRTRRMFGGLGLYCGDLFFGLADDEAIYIKADDVNEAAFVEAGCRLFSYPGKDGQVLTMRYRQLPDAAMDDPEEAVRWVQRGVEAAARARPPASRRPVPVETDTGFRRG